MTTTSRSLAEVLQTATDFLVEHSDLPSPYITGIEFTSSGEARVDLNWYLTIGETAGDHAEQKALAARILRTVGGKWEKDRNPGESFSFDQRRDGLHLKVQVEREAVCERVVTGVKTVTVPAKPAEPARTVEHEVVEWRCEPVLAEVSA